MTNAQTSTSGGRNESPLKSWQAQIKTAKGIVTIERSKKPAPYAIQQNN